MELMQRTQEVEKRFFIHRLRRSGDVLMALIEGLVRSTGRSQQVLQSRTPMAAHFGDAVAPLVG